MPPTHTEFDPQAILSALERRYVDYVLIGGLAQVLRGVDVVTTNLDICPSFGRGNLRRLSDAIADSGLRRGGAPAEVTEPSLADERVLRVTTTAGDLGVVGAPAGIPNGYAELRRAATREDLGGGVRPLVASSGDLAAMAAALHRDQDAERLVTLRRIVELEARREPIPGPERAAARTPARRAGRRTAR